MAKYIKETHEKFVTMEPERLTKTRKKETSAEIKKIREKSTMRQFPNRLGKLIPSFKDFEINDYKDKWKILEE